MASGPCMGYQTIEATLKKKKPYNFPSHLIGIRMVTLLNSPCIDYEAMHFPISLVLQSIPLNLHWVPDNWTSGM